jgi:endonuclease YncB( thermonuclease family)
MNEIHKSATLLPILAIALMTPALTGFADKAPPERGISTVAVINEWYDGDTATATISLDVRLRTLDCWAPEVKGPEKAQGLLSKKRVQEIAPPGSKVRIFIPSTGKLQDSLTFGRPLAHIWIEQKDGTYINVGEKMVREGFATKDKKK